MEEIWVSETECPDGKRIRVSTRKTTANRYYSVPMILDVSGKVTAWDTAHIRKIYGAYAARQIHNSLILDYKKGRLIADATKK